MSMFVVAPKEKFGLAKLEDDISAHLGKRICSVILQGHLQVQFIELIVIKIWSGKLFRKETVFWGQILMSNACRAAQKPKDLSLKRWCKFLGRYWL
jgi:hypothetical protein